MKSTFLFHFPAFFSLVPFIRNKAVYAWDRWSDLTNIFFFISRKRLITILKGIHDRYCYTLIVVCFSALKGQCHEVIAVLSQFCAEETTYIYN